MERVQRAAQSSARRAFAASVSTLPGPKTVFVERALYDTRTSSALCIRAFADNAFLLEHGVRDVVPFPSQRAEKLLRIDAPPRGAVFLLRGPSARGALDLVRLLRSRRTQEPTGPLPPLKCVVLVTPRASPTVQRILDRSGGPPLRTEPLPLGFLPYDSDVLTLDWPSAYRELVLGGDSSAILAAARGLVSLADSLRLRFAPIRSAGPAAAAVAEEILETHGRRYAKLGSRKPRPADATLSSFGSPSGSSRIMPAPRNLPPPLSLLSTTKSSVSEIADDTMSIAESEFYGSDNFSVATTREKGPSPTYGQLKKKRAEVNLVLLDRGVDIVSTLLSQWTYEGLLDESLGLGNNVLAVSVSDLKTEDAAAVFRAPEGTSNTAAIMKLKLRADSDALFAQVRDMSYWAASARIGKLASGVKEYYKARPERETAEIARVRDYVLGLKEKKSEHRRASEHLALAAEISARTFEHIPFKRRFEFERELLEGGNATVREVYVTDSVARGESLEHVLRLACLWSVTSGGIDGQVLNFVRREIVATFGLSALRHLANLERAGLLTRSTRTESNSWLSLAGFGGNGKESEDNTGRGEEESDAASETQSVSSFRSKSSPVAPPRASGTAPTARTRAAPTHSWHFARAALRLVSNFDPESDDRGEGTTWAPYLGYTPMSVRLIEVGLGREGWSRLPPVAARTPLLPVGHAAVEHRAASEEISKEKAAAGGNGLPFDAIVMFVGGVMRAEMSAIQLAARAAGKRILILTTHVLGADEFVASFGEDY